jgi:hypothetical protein
MREDVNLAHVTGGCLTACNNSLKERNVWRRRRTDLDLAGGGVGGGDELLLVVLSGEILSLYRGTPKLSRV